MIARETNEQDAGGHHDRPAVNSQKGRGWLRRNYTLVLVLLVPGAIGLFALAVMKVRKIDPPTPADLAYWAAHRFVAEGQHLEALHHVGVAALADPDRLDTALLLARLRLKTGGDGMAQIRADLEKRLEKQQRGDGVGALHALLARSYSESDPGRAAEHENAAAELQPETAAAYYLRSVSTPRAEEAFAWLDKGLSLDSDHVPSLKASALALHRLRRFDVMNIVLRRADEARPGDASTLFLVALALRAGGDPDGALPVQETVLQLLPQDPEAYRQRSLTHLLRRDFKKAAMDAGKAVALAPLDLRRFYRIHLLRMLIAAGQLENLKTEFLDAPADSRLEDWILTGVAEQAAFEKYVAGRDLDVPESLEGMPLFRAMLDTASLARTLAEKGRRIVRRAFGASFAPDGKRLAFTRGVPGASLIEILDLESRRVSTPGPDGRDPSWSPDGKLVAFVRQGEATEWTELTLLSGRSPAIRRGEEVWLMTPDGHDVRRLVAGGAPAWSRDSKRIYFHQGTFLKSIAIDPDHPAETTHFEITSSLPPSVSRDEMSVATHVVDANRNELHVVRLDTGLPAQRWDSPRRDARGLTATWSPSGQELAVSGLPGDDLGLWIFNVESRNTRRVLAGDSMAAVWSPDGTRLIVELRAPFWELWSIPLDETFGEVEK